VGGCEAVDDEGDMYYIVSDWVACVLGQLVCGLTRLYEATALSNETR
jgi:hypothetical protein